MLASSFLKSPYPFRSVFNKQTSSEAIVILCLSTIFKLLSVAYNSRWVSLSIVFNVLGRFKTIFVYTVFLFQYDISKSHSLVSCSFYELLFTSVNALYSSRRLMTSLNEHSYLTVIEEYYIVNQPRLVFT